jgi:carboxy-cis,cis-muconate cyclase
VNSATSSCYISENGAYTFSAGGSGARINAIDEDGGIGETVHEMFYVPKEEIPNVDKTRKAVVSLRAIFPSFAGLISRTHFFFCIQLTRDMFRKLYGAHGFDVNVNSKGFVPHL